MTPSTSQVVLSKSAREPPKIKVALFFNSAVILFSPKFFKDIMSCGRGSG